MGHEILLFNRDFPEFTTADGMACITGDVRNFEDFGPRIRSMAPETVLVDMFHFSTRDASRIVRTLKGVAERMVVISGTDVYRAYGRLFGLEPGPLEAVPLTEDAPLRSRLFPGMETTDKLAVETAVMADPEMPGTILRLPPVYGPRSMMHRVYFYLKRMDDNRPFILLSRYLAAWQWTHGYVEDVARAIALACTDGRANGRVYNTGEPAPVSMLGWLRRIGKSAGWNGEIIICPHSHLAEVSPFALMGINTAQDVTVDSTRIRQELGYSETVDPDEALVRTIAWERSNPIPARLMGPEWFDYDAEDRLALEIRNTAHDARTENYH